MRADEPLAGAGARETKGRNEMFEQSFVEGVAKTNRGWPVVASLMLQVSVVTVAVLVPLLNPEILPRAIVAATLLSAPSLPPAPPPPNPMRSMARVVKNMRSLLDAGKLMAPVAMPKKLVVLDAPEEPVNGNRDGVPGGIPTGAHDAVITSLLTSARPPAPVESAPVKSSTAVTKDIPRTTMGGNVVEALLVNKVIPAYPVMARQTRTEGKVVFQAVISREGTIQSLRLVSGHALLVQAAMDAVRQWRYKPSMLNGEPCEVDTVITVNFTLNR